MLPMVIELDFAVTMVETLAEMIVAAMEIAVMELPMTKITTELVTNTVNQLEVPMILIL
jgi:hypothetical protein